MPKNKTVFEDCDILVVGGGMAGTGAVSYTHLTLPTTPYV